MVSTTVTGTETTAAVMNKTGVVRIKTVVAITNTGDRENQDDGDHRSRGVQIKRNPFPGAQTRLKAEQEAPK
jgi:hypothetical protein